MKFKGTQATLAKLKAFGAEAESRISAITQATAEQIATDAARNLNAYPGGDEYGKIAQSINVEPKTTGLLNYKIGVNQVPMGAYIEFGTGVFVDVPPGWENIAMAFYVNGQGWMQPQPYLYPAYYKGRKQYKKDLKDLLDHLISRTNN